MLEDFFSFLFLQSSILFKTFTQQSSFLKYVELFRRCLIVSVESKWRRTFDKRVSAYLLRSSMLWFNHPLAILNTSISEVIRSSEFASILETKLYSSSKKLSSSLTIVKQRCI